jgi:hypothetical protein
MAGLEVKQAGHSLQRAEVSIQATIDMGMTALKLHETLQRKFAAAVSCIRNRYASLCNGEEAMILSWFSVNHSCSFWRDSRQYFLFRATRDILSCFR